MADRSVVVRLRAEVGEYKRAMAEARKATEDALAAAPAGVAKAQSALGRMVSSARDNRAAWEDTGRVLLGVGGAITAIGVASFKTGIEYNTLQQTSRAALTTLLGSAQAANAQMDKLDEFARESPFAKQVFITAQRQMLGFGIEARKVIPYLESIQNAVAATGGSNDDISELVRIFSQVKAAAKITAVDLMQFGQRGVDAATLIGSQMGKTGAQIREEISKGSLDAQVALDALAAGMQDRFGGAAENVKGTFLGAVDRVKAAWRDLSSDLAAPFVDPRGGGMAVEWLNGLADQMRDFQDLPEPIKLTAAALGAVLGVSTLLGGAFLILFPRLVEVYDGLGKLGPAGEKAQRGMKGLADSLPAAGRAAGWAVAVFAVAELTIELGQYAAAAQVGKTSTDDLVKGLNNLANAKDDVGGLGSLFSQGAGPFRREAKDMTAVLDQFAISAREALGQDFWEQLDRRFDTTGSEMTRFTTQATALDEALAKMARAGNADTAAQAFETLTSAAAEQGVEVDDLIDKFPLYQKFLEETGEAAQAGAAGVQLFGTATDEAREALEEWLTMVGDADASFVGLQGAYDGVIAKNQEIAQSTADATEDAADSWQTYYDGVSVSAADYIAQLQAQVTAQENWEVNMITLAQRVNTGMTGEMRDAARGMIDELIGLGPEGAAQVELLKNMTDEELAQVVTLWANKGEAAKDEFNAQMARLVQPVVVLQADVSSAQGVIDRFIRSNTGRTIMVNAQGQTVGFRMGPGAQAGFGGGGYTGDGGVAEPAGVVHGKEFVVNARATARNRPLLEAINRGVPGYDTGGYVSPRFTQSVAPSWSPRPAPAAAGARISVAVTADAGLAAEFAYDVAMKTTRRLQDTLAAHGIDSIVTGG